MWSVVAKCAYLIPHLHICSDWLITKKSNIQSSVWATWMKLGMWVVMGTSTSHVVCRHQMCIFNTSFAYLFSLSNNKIKVNIQSFVWATVMKRGMWVVVGTSITHQVCDHWMCIFNNSFAYMLWLANKKRQLSRVSVWATQLCILEVSGSGGNRYYPCVCHHGMHIFNT